MHVLFINARYVPEGIGGPAFSVKFLAEQLVREGDRATVFCRSDRPGVSREVLEGVDVIRVGGELDEKDVVDELRRSLVHFKPDVVHTNFLRDIPIEAVTAEIQAHQLRRIHTLRVADPEQARRALATELSAVVGVSQFVLDFHDRLGLCRHVSVKRVIHNSYSPPEGTASLGVPLAKGEPLRLGYLGRLDPSKGVEYLLKVLTKEMHEDAWTLTVAGAGTPNFERRLKRKFADPRIRMLGLSRPVDLF
jgi:glycosyltransferase involved in cell wall biosynthesis